MFLGLEGLVPSTLIQNEPKWGPNCADDVPVRGRNITSIIWEPILASLGPGGVQNPRKAISTGLEHGSLCRLPML